MNNDLEKHIFLHKSKQLIPMRLRLIPIKVFLVLPKYRSESGDKAQKSVIRLKSLKANIEELRLF